MVESYRKSFREPAFANRTHQERVSLQVQTQLRPIAPKDDMAFAAPRGPAAIGQIPAGYSMATILAALIRLVQDVAGAVLRRVFRHRVRSVFHAKWVTWPSKQVANSTWSKFLRNATNASRPCRRFGTMPRCVRWRRRWKVLESVGR